MTRKITLQQHEEQICLRAVLHLNGMRQGMLHLHTYLMRNRRWHTSTELAEHFDRVNDSIVKWANVLERKGWIQRRESVGIQEGEGGRYPAEFRATPGCKSIEKKFKLAAEKATKKLGRVR